MKLATTLGLVFAVLTSAIPYPPPRIVFQPWENNLKPWEDTATVKLANDWSGKHAEAKVPLDRKRHSIKSLYGNSDLVQSGGIYATSAELTKFSQRTGCVVVLDDPEVYAQLNAQNTWSFLDRGAWVNVKDGYVSCVEY
ncbi:hypothetical protein EYZ11_006292 [Aspergillus tanneri]|uniref:Uncharacterized protein n=1 Tax=Aspergillus tanneri TaxID=1220188 RepID=A0A4S3JLR3_9EURO|nr:uncharacterized protein ATNIH1004_008026 [Aspergillus tanneri]KAA8646593.1 hypothetical protein ATNIH1004_008026 [Aspergillus tanneri]THC94241.1 hypothetical protein EYZ11_006292 [Aspergillus tanneri]